MINIIIKIFLIVLFLSANGYEDDNFKVCPGKEDSFANSKLARRFQVKGNVFACKECEECDEYKINALYSSDIEKNIADGGFLEDYVSYKETEENTENTGTCETVKAKSVLKVDNIVFNQNLTLTLCAGKSTNSCDEKVLEMFYSMNENKIISKDHMYKLKETDKNKDFNVLNGEQFNLNFIVQDKSIIVNFLKDGDTKLNLEFVTGSSAEELEINLLQLGLDTMPRNFEFDSTRMLHKVTGTGTGFVNKDSGNKISFMLMFEFPKDDKSTKDEPTTGFVHLITQSTGKGEKGDITDNVTAVYVKKENKKIPFKINFGGGKADRIIKLAVTFNDSLGIERSVPKIELSKISRIFVSWKSYYKYRFMYFYTQIVGSQQDVMLLQADILEPKK
uniref:Uncharacterized protein n=1 Tax=Meloidogyne javanica TaxID=6303 RepID=A0A915LIQ9_MELJA